MRATVLPPSVFGPGPLRWLYLTMAVHDGRRDGHHVCAAVRSATGAPDPADGRIPGCGAGARLDGQRDRQRLAGQPPEPRAGDRGRAGDDGSRSGLGAVTQRDDAPTTTVALWALGLLVAGVGIGMAWPHLSVRAMDAVDDPADPTAGGVAAAAINIVQLISAAFGAGLAGVVVNSDRRQRRRGGSLVVHRIHRVGRAGCFRLLPGFLSRDSPGLTAGVELSPASSSARSTAINPVDAGEDVLCAFPSWSRDRVIVTPTSPSSISWASASSSVSCQFAARRSAAPPATRPGRSRR